VEIEDSSAERNLLHTRLVGLLQCLTGIWLMYCTYAATVNFALGEKAWI
jgi:hypothetical protein